MKPKLYLLVFDPYKTNAAALHNIVTTMPLKTDWWHYIGSAYVLASYSTAKEMQDYINVRWKGFFLLSEINAHNSGGWLPQEAWNWINTRR